MWRLLFVEDDPKSVEPVIAYLERKSGGYRCEICDFNGMTGKMDEFRPDVIILDLLEDGGSAERKPVGNEKLRDIWKQRFRPVVIYSAQTDALEEGEWSGNPFVQAVQKGIGSETKVEEAIGLFMPHVEALNESEAFINQSLIHSMRDVAPYVFEEFSDISDRKDAFLRLTRRRLAALMDDSGKSGRLASWECYIYPPAGDSIRLGDVLMKREGNKEDPNSFRVVLTPSCDLVCQTDRKAKVDHVLVAKCIPTQSGVRIMSQIAQMKQNEFLEKIDKMVLSQGFYQRLIPFPILKGQIPLMMADLKDLELLPFEGVADGAGSMFARVASIDSPFRELISWAYMHTACRPGLPDRDFEKWMKEIKGAYDS